MRRLLGLVVALILCCPTQLLADPLGNLGQLFPFVGFLFCIPSAVLIWSLAYRGKGGRMFAAWPVGLIAVAALLLLGVIKFGWATASLLFAFGFMALTIASPLIVLWCVLWWFIASRAYQRRRVPAPVIAVLGIMIMIGLSVALIWALFPSTCRQMFGL